MSPGAGMLGYGDRDRIHAIFGLRARSLISRIEGEDPGAERGRWLELGGAFAFDWRGYRCVHDFGEAALRRLPELLDWFESGPAPSFETSSASSLEILAGALIRLGYQPCHDHAFFMARLDALEPAGGRDTTPLEISWDPADFGRLGARMWHEGDPERAHALARQHAGPAWSCMTVFEAGRALAGTSLFLDGAYALHANALTLPEARGRGLHARLLAAHIELARGQGKTWIVADTQVGSSSGRNLERAGLRCVASCLGWRARADEA